MRISDWSSDVCSSDLPYGVEQIHAACREKGIPLAMLPGDEQPDPALAVYSTLAEEAALRQWRYCVEGGPDNARSFLAYTASLPGQESDWKTPRPLQLGRSSRRVGVCKTV